MNISRYLLAALLGALVSFLALTSVDDDAHLRAQLATFEQRIQALELTLVQKDDELSRARAFARFEQQLPGVLESLEKPLADNGDISLAAAVDSESPAHDLSVDEKIRELSTNSDRDPRSFSQKVQDLLVAEASKENIAIASKGMFDLADNRETLPDQELAAVFYSHTDSDLKRVAAQVMSLRGDNSLLDKQVGEAQPGLRSEDPAQRQKTLVELAKTRYAGAANLIAPLLQDEDTGVKLDALLALRATGNQGHVHLVEALVNHSDPAVSWLAKDVMDNLQNLSDKARTRIATNEISEELPFFSEH